MSTKTVHTQVQELVDLLTETVVDADKFTNKNNKAAGTRVRKALMSVANSCKDIRKQVSAEKNASS